MANNVAPEGTEPNESVTDGNVDSILARLDEELASLGQSVKGSDIPDTPREPKPAKAPKPQAPAVQSDKVTIDGVEVPLDAVRTWRQDSATRQQWQAQLQQQQQAAAVKRNDLANRIAALKAETYDDDNQKLITILEEQQKQLDDQSKYQQSVQAEREFMQARQYVATAKQDLEARYDVTLPDMDTPEFREIVDMAQNGNKLEMGYLLWNKLHGEAGKPRPKPTAVTKKPVATPAKPRLGAIDNPNPTAPDPGTDIPEATLREARKAGVSIASLKAGMAMRGIG